jgi:hypothetical protein
VENLFFGKTTLSLHRTTESPNGSQVVIFQELRASEEAQYDEEVGANLPLPVFMG